ncbi:MAG: protein-glutamate O-methyltransferase CheR [Magnetococcales bacterium]|nr:protein-glutamate O-methyltransferase CheR [Magnetococcales bacterium]
MSRDDLQDFEIRLLLESLRYRYDFDFSNYVQTSLKRRLLYAIKVSGIEHVSDAIPRVLHDEDFFQKLFYILSVTVTEFFRDPQFYKTVREQLTPLLDKFPIINVWHAGCATGEEVYSMAILLHEEGLSDRVRIYATDINNRSLSMAKEGVYNIDNLKDYSINYQKSGGKGSLSDYYIAKYGLALIDPELKKNILFSNFNLATDSVFTEMHLVLCRNVLIYFDATLQNRVLTLLNDTLVDEGLLCLGSRESLKFSNVVNSFIPISEKWRIFQKKPQISNEL